MDKGDEVDLVQEWCMSEVILGQCTKVMYL